MSTPLAFSVSPHGLLATCLHRKGQPHAWQMQQISSLTCLSTVQAKAKTQLKDAREKARAGELAAQKQLAGLQLVCKDGLTDKELASLARLVQPPDQVHRELQNC